jgi:serine/threonine protein kinase
MHDLSCTSFLASGEAWRDPSPVPRGRPGGGAPPGNPVTTPFPRFLSTERVCSEAEQGLPCEICPISQGREKAEKGLCGGETLRTSPAGTGERRLESGYSIAVPLHGSAVPLLTNGACTPSQAPLVKALSLCYNVFSPIRLYSDHRLRQASHHATSSRSAPFMGVFERAVQAHELIGKRLGRYQIERMLGVGGVAAVYAALDLALHRSVALKVLLPHPALPPVILERFRLEAITAARLDHPNIVPIYDVGEIDGLVYIGMKLIPGETLGDVLARTGRLDEADAAELIAQIADALDYAHSQGIVHRDVKPANILLTWSIDDKANTRHCHAYLTDFGIARALDAPDLTQAGLTVGTPAYMSPEQAAGERSLDGRSDLYSLGVVLYHCLAGRPPFVGGTAYVLHAHVYNPPPPLPPDVSPGMAAIVARALHKDRAGRYQTGAEMATALRALLAGEGARERRRRAPIKAPSQRVRATAEGTAPDEMPDHRSTRLRQRFLLGLLILIMAGVGTGILITGRWSASKPTILEVSTLRTEVVIPTPSPTLPLTDTPVPVSTFTPTPTDTITPSPTATWTPSATSQPVQALPPPPTTTPTETSTPAFPCSLAPHLAFREWLAIPGQLDRIGCPTDGAATSPALVQQFEHGQMIWRQDRYWIYVVYDDGTWEVLEDTWEEGDLPFDPELTPPAGMHQPLGRLGKVWREQPRVRERLGWAMADEMTFTGIFQPFEKGELIAQPPEQMYVLLEDLRLRALSFEGGLKEATFHWTPTQKEPRTWR